MCASRLWRSIPQSSASPTSSPSETATTEKHAASSVSPTAYGESAGSGGIGRHGRESASARVATSSYSSACRIATSSGWRARNAMCRSRRTFLHIGSGFVIEELTKEYRWEYASGGRPPQLRGTGPYERGYHSLLRAVSTAPAWLRLGTGDLGVGHLFDVLEEGTRRSTKGPKSGLWRSPGDALPPSPTRCVRSASPVCRRTERLPRVGSALKRRASCRHAGKGRRTRR